MSKISHFDLEAGKLSREDKRIIMLLHDNNVSINKISLLFRMTNYNMKEIIKIITTKELKHGTKITGR